MSEISPLFAVEAEQLLFAGYIEDAVNLCEAGLKEYPNYPTAYSILSRALMQSGNSEKAKQIAGAAKKRFAGNIKLLSQFDNILDEIQRSSPPEITVPKEETENDIPEEIEEELTTTIGAAEELESKAKLAEEEEGSDENDAHAVEVSEADMADSEEEFEKVSDESAEGRLEEKPGEPDISEEIIPQESESRDESVYEDINSEEEKGQSDKAIETEQPDQTVEESGFRIGKMEFLKPLLESEKQSGVSLELRADNPALIPGLDYSPLKMSGDTAAPRNHAQFIIPPPVEKSIGTYEQSDDFMKDLDFQENIVSKTDPRKKIPDLGAQKKNSVEDLAEKLNKFISSRPSIPVEKPIETDQKSHDDSDFVTETMAEIYEKQGAISAAIDAYKKLAAENPDKRDYYEKKAQELSSGD